MGSTPQSSVVATAPPPSSNLPPAALPHTPPAQAEAKSAPGALQFEELWANCSRPQWKPNPNLLVFSNSNPFHPGTEQFRTLRSRLYRMRDSQPLQTILISSAIPAEGKTMVSTNLAYALVRQRGCRVLLIDADLRSPRVHTVLGAPANPGLADYLQNGSSEFEVIQRGHEEGLCFIPAGNHVTHPSELISSDRMKQFLDRAKPAFDWIIIDSPPALPVADASVLGGCATECSSSFARIRRLPRHLKKPAKNCGTPKLSAWSSTPRKNPRNTTPIIQAAPTPACPPAPRNEK